MEFCKYYPHLIRDGHFKTEATCLVFSRLINVAKYFDTELSSSYSFYKSTEENSSKPYDSLCEELCMSKKKINKSLEEVRTHYKDVSDLDEFIKKDMFEPFQGKPFYSWVSRKDHRTYYIANWYLIKKMLKEKPRRKSEPKNKHVKNKNTVQKVGSQKEPTLGYEQVPKGNPLLKKQVPKGNFVYYSEEHSYTEQTTKEVVVDENEKGEIVNTSTERLEILLMEFGIPEQESCKLVVTYGNDVVQANIEYVKKLSRPPASPSAYLIKAIQLNYAKASNIQSQAPRPLSSGIIELPKANPQGMGYRTACLAMPNLLKTGSRNLRPPASNDGETSKSSAEQ